MAKKNINKNTRRITQGGQLPTPGQTEPKTIILRAPQRFGIDIGTYMRAIRSADNVDYARNTSLFNMLADILMDAHLTSVLEKRTNAVLRAKIEFRKANGEIDETIKQQINSPWFNQFLRDAMDGLYWGFSLMQFYRNSEGWIGYDLISRKNVDPIRRLILHNETDIQGTPWEDFENLIFIGEAREYGLLAKAAPWVIYKRNTTADWAQFSEVFGMPIRQYTYDGGDEETRSRIIEDAENQGSAAVFILPNDANLELKESGNKSGSAELYKSLHDTCNAEISKLILWNTLTTEASSTGTQALGTVHKKVEEGMGESDLRYILNILNYDMTDIFSALAINTAGGKFVVSTSEELDTTTNLDLLLSAKNNLKLPIEDDYLYEQLGIPKPENYDALKEGMSLPAANEIIEVEHEEEKGINVGKPKPSKTPAFKNTLRRFFVRAPKSGALEW